MALFTEADIVELVPDILEYGIQDFSDDIARTEEDIFRLLRIQWWQPIARRSGEMDTTKLDPTELKRSCVYHCLAYFVFPVYVLKSNGMPLCIPNAFHKNFMGFHFVCLCIHQDAIVSCFVFHL